jgi:lipopolysaccharide export LptBFGC system permease protein LptF
VCIRENNMTDKMKDIEQWEYENLFRNKSNDAKAKEQTEKALKYAIETRKFEIELYWKRASYFWTFIAAIFAGYLLKGSESELSFLIACVGLVFSFAWFLANKGSKF